MRTRTGRQAKQNCERKRKLLSEEQKRILDKYGVYSGEDIDLVLDELENKVLEIGYLDNWESLNDTGAMLERLYDEIYAQEDDDEE